MGNGSLRPSGSGRRLKSVVVDGGPFRQSLGFCCEFCDADQVDLSVFSPFVAGRGAGGAYLDRALSRQRFEMFRTELD